MNTKAIYQLLERNIHKEDEDKNDNKITLHKRSLTLELLNDSFLGLI